MSTALNPLVEKIRGAHPGAYDDMDDAALTKRVLAKYPQYSDLAAPPASAAPGGPKTQPMETSHLAESLSPATSTRSAIANPQQPAEQFALDNPEQQGKLAASAAVGAIGPSVPGIAQVARAHPLITTGVLTAAQQAPGAIGRIANKIPTWLPLFAGEGKGAIAAPEAQAAEEAETIAAPQTPQRRIATPAEPEAAPVPHSEWPPPEPAGAYDKPVPAPRGISDLRDDEAVKEGIRAQIGQADRKVFASHRERNDVSVPKGVLTGEINKPVTYTKTSGAKARGVSKSPPVPAGTTVPGPDEDMTPLLKKSVAAAKKGKKGD